MKLKKRTQLLIIMLMSIIPKLILLVGITPMYAPSDETWMLGILAKLCGYDWNDVLANGSYYGTGFTILLYPLFRFIEDPFVLYNIMVSIYIVLAGGIAWICYTILSKFLNVVDNVKLIVLSVTSSYLMCLPVVYIYNEFVLQFIMWLLVLIVLYLEKNIDNVLAKRKYTIGLVLLLSYSLTIHTRAYTFWGAVILIFIIYKIVFKKWLVDIKVFAIVSIVCVVIATLFVEGNISYIWGDITKEIANTSVNLSGINNIFDEEYLLTVCRIVLGQLNSGMAFTGMSLLIAACVGLIYVGNMFSKDFFKGYPERKTMLVLVVITFAPMVATILAQSISWLGQTQSAIIENEYEHAALRSMSYIRYYMAYAAPIIVIVLAKLDEEREKLLQKRMLYFGLFIGVHVFWIAQVLPYIYRNTMTSRGNSANSYLMYSMQELPLAGSDMSYFMPASVFMCFMIFFFYMLLKNKKTNIIIGIVSLIICAQYFYRGEGSKIVQEDFYSNVNSAYRTVTVLEENGCIDERQTVYLLESDIYNQCELQFLLRDNSVVSEIPEAEAKYIAFADRAVIKGIPYDAYCKKLDSNEYIYIVGYDDAIAYLKESN